MFLIIVRLQENAYDQVILTRADAEIKKPVILHGELAESARAALIKASPEEFCDGHKSHGGADKHRLFVGHIDGNLSDLESAVNISITE